jgi:hypothetical protein
MSGIGATLSDASISAALAVIRLIHAKIPAKARFVAVQKYDLASGSY